MKGCVLAAALAVLAFAPGAQAAPRKTTRIPVQTITVTNVAGVPGARLREVERAIIVQSWQLREFWNTPLVRFAPGGWPVRLAPHTDCITVNNRCVLRGAPGYHNGHGPTFGEVSTLDLGPNPSWTVAFSHEILEMLADPSGTAYIDGYEREVCDVVETAFYQIRGVWVSDFATPSWFRYGATFAPNVKLDWLGRVHTPGDDSLS